MKLHSVFVVTAVFACAAAYADEPAFRCDAKDQALFEEMKAAGRTGLGETWDEHTCNQGAIIYTPGVAESGSGPFRSRSTKRMREEQALALVMPLVVGGGFGVALLGAMALTLVVRMKKRVVLEVACPACDASLPIDAELGAAQHLFCPMCGAPCLVDVVGKGKQASASARVLV